MKQNGNYRYICTNFLIMTKRQVFGTAILIILAIIGFVSNKKKATKDNGLQYVYEEGKVHGTIYHITYEIKDGKSLQGEYEDEFKLFDQSLSTFQKNSIISRINQNDTTVVVDEYFKTVFNVGQAISEKTGGAFDMTVAPLVNAWGFGFDKKANVTEEEIREIMPHIGYQKIKLNGNRVVKSDSLVMLDASAIAKGYSSDVVAQLLEKHGVENYMVEIGGECVVKGHNEKGKPWCLGITKPQDDSTQQQNEIQTLIHIGKGGLATSGNYRQFYYKDGKKYAHTINPHTGHPVDHNLLSATIYGPTCMEADAYATACMVLGVEKAKELIESIPELEGYFIYSDKDNNYVETCTKGFEKLQQQD